MADHRTISSSYSLLHPSIQKWVHAKKWKQLNDVQEGAIPPILGAERDVILSAATAAGKTEGAFLPICSALLVNNKPEVDIGFRVLYVSPLKALINDQYQRLNDLCGQLHIPVHRWHGDVAGAMKKKIASKPNGILLITPESLEALFVLRGPDIGRIFASLGWVVIDEMHSFIGTERGMQLQSLLHRLELVLRRRVPRIGLSATLGDMESSASFLRPGSGDLVEIVESTHGGGEAKLQARGYIDAVKTDSENTEPDDDSSSWAIADHMFTVLRGRNHLVFVNQRGKAELFADRLRIKCEDQRVPNEFFPHHGNLAKDVREHVEERLKAGRPTTALCTSTLEMGIDIGAVASVAQVGAPPSVASLRQRLGRAGRRGEPAILRMYITEREVTAHTPPIDQLRAELFQAVAMVDLLRERWYEPPNTSSLHLSTLIQQILSVIAQHQGAQAVELWNALCVKGPFQRIDKPSFGSLLRDLGQAKLLQQESDGLLLLGAAGERIVSHFSFYAAFASPEEYRLVNGSRSLGTLPILFPIPLGSMLIFAGRRWKVLSVDDRVKLVEVKLAGGGHAPKFAGGSAEIHAHVRHRMRQWYEGNDVPVYLDSTARRLLEEGRATYRRFELASEAYIAWGKNLVVFPWAGDRVLNTLAVWLNKIGSEASQDGVALNVSDCSPTQFLRAVQEMLNDDGIDGANLASTVPNSATDKYDEYLGKSLRSIAYEHSHLDLPGAKAALKQFTEMDIPRRHPRPPTGATNMN